jgi:hypothetical protein
MKTILLSIYLLSICPFFGITNSLFNMPKDNYLINIYGFTSAKNIVFDKRNICPFILLDKENENKILNVILSILDNVKEENYFNEDIFFQTPSIYFELGSFENNDRDTDGLIKSDWLNIYYNPFSKRILGYKNGKKYIYGKLNVISKDILGMSLTEIKPSSEIDEFCIYYKKSDNFEIKDYYLLANNNFKKVLSIDSAYDASKGQLIKLIKGSYQLEVVDSIGRGTSVNTSHLKIYEINIKKCQLRKIFDIPISGYNGSGPEDYWKSNYSFVDIDNDGNMEIIIEDLKGQISYKYNMTVQRYVIPEIYRDCQ